MAALDPAGRTVMISGANRGIGRAIAERLYREGYSLCLGARDPASLVAVAEGMDPARVMVHAYEALDPDLPGRWVAATRERFGRIDALVNNAGLLRTVTATEGGEDELELMWRVNARGPWRLIRAAWPHLAETGAGRIVNVASITGLRVKSAAATGYAMSKFALVALTHGVRLEGWRLGIRASALCPGFVATEMTEGWTEFPRADMVDPDSLAAMAAMLIALPNNASVAALTVNCRAEPVW